MTLPFYPFYWGDYSAKTFNLTNTQHGIYILLLRNIYTGGEPMDTVEKCYEIAKASPEQHRDVDLILLRFFSKEKGVWTSKKAIDVMKESEKKHQTNVSKGKKGGRPPKAELKPNLSPAKVEPKQLQLQPEPILRKKDTTYLSKENPKSNFPDQFSLDMASQKVADSFGLTDNQVLFEIDAMRDWAVNAGAKGRRKDWQAFARTWFRNNRRKPNGKDSSNTIKSGLDLIRSAISSEHFNRGTPVRNGDGEADIEVIPRLRQIYP